MEKMDGMSMDLLAENIAQLKMLFPEAVTEGKVDFDVLKALLGGEIEQRQEYYKFTWNGKEAARAYARTRSMGTLRPCVEESSGKDGTAGKFDSENLYIEGDNLEVLKLLQGPYHKKVKMIYIDPPYNTGKDFVYPDNFKDSIGNYKALTGQTDDEGKSTRANPETSGRYHTDWLNMMYPRLILARNLLTDDGVIFISIDDSEQNNLTKLCNEVFGEENFIGVIIRKTKSMTADSFNGLNVQHEVLLVFAKNNEKCILRGEEKAFSAYSNPDNDPNGAWCAGDPSAKSGGDSTYFAIKNPYTNREDFPPNGRYWAFSKSTLEKYIQDGKVKFKQIYGPNERGFIFKRYKKDATLFDPVHTLFATENEYMNQAATIEVKSLFEQDVFSYPKPVALVKKLLAYSTEKNSIILDFFSGSGTAAHAVEQLNAEDGGNRKYIMVQLPEVCEAGTEAAKAGYSNICEIGKERIRRAAKKIKGEYPDWNGDMGFKVFKLDTSNLLPWNPNADELEQNLFAAVDNVLEGRTTDDLLHEILLKCNLPLTLPIEKKQCGNNTIYLVGAGALAICLDKPIPATIAEEIVKLRDEYAPIVPMQVVFRDNGFNDVIKTNALQILKQAGFEEKSIQTI